MQGSFPMEMPRGGNRGKLQPRDFSTVSPALGKSRKGRGISHIPTGNRGWLYFNLRDQSLNQKPNLENSRGLPVSCGERYNRNVRRGALPRSTRTKAHSYEILVIVSYTTKALEVRCVADWRTQFRNTGEAAGITLALHLYSCFSIAILVLWLSTPLLLCARIPVPPGDEDVRGLAQHAPLVFRGQVVQLSLAKAESENKEGI